MRKCASPITKNVSKEKKKKRKHEDLSSEESMKVDLISELPAEISLKILLKLPTEAVCRCMWVSKAWQNTITHPGFIKMHQTMVVHTNSPGLIVFSDDSCREIFIDQQGLAQFLSDSSSQPVENYPKPKQSGALFSCNGVVFSGRRPYFMCNPITREYIDIPNPPIYRARRHYFMGVGFDMVSKVFKVVIMMEFLNEICQFETDVQIYNSGTNEWKRIPNLHYLFAYESLQLNLNVLLKGALHWIGGLNDPDARKGVVSFDLHTEEFRQVSLPRKFQKAWRLDYNLLVLGDCLCICDKIKHEHIKIYVMKEYGMVSSWVKEYVIKNLGSNYCKIEGPYKPIKLMKNGEILVLCLGAFGYYNPKTDVFRLLDVRVGSPHSLPVLHEASLISLKN